MNEDTGKPSNMRNIIIVAVIIIIGIFAYFIARPPVLSVSPDPPSFNFDISSAGARYQTFYLFNTGGGTLSWNVKADQPWWIKVYPESGTGSGTVTININAADLVPGNYKGTITVTSNGGVKTGSIYLNLVSAPSRIVDGTSGAQRITLAVGETWSIGDGWSVQAQAIDAKATPKQIWLVLSRNGIKLDDKVLSEGETYNYNNIFSVKIASIYAGAVSDMATLTDVAYQKGR
ncbi:MAG: S-layer protein domain-containing protein [Candidatus Methanoperedens sp.]|nr:S-layer protein domain-containing protein [Candidatus Methanoperedens sp.]MCZ7403765.1 S-layer protein domain-containing protein [Candidatus Methanoperedens sp.]